MSAKEIAGIKAAEFVDEGMVVGLGTGSTSFFAIKALGHRIKNGLNIKAHFGQMRIIKMSAETLWKFNIEIEF